MSNRQNHDRQTTRNHPRRKAAFLAGSALVLLAVAGCSDDNSDFDISRQIGPNPYLPEQSAAILPDLKVAEVIGWKDGETPKVAEGLTVTAYAKDLVNPRRVYTLPNGDVLAVQSRGPAGEAPTRPKDIIRGWIMSIAHGGGSGPQKESNKITLLRDTNHDGKVDERSDLLTGLDSPFGVVFADNTLYVAATDAILAYPYTLGETKITAAPKVLTPLPGGPIDHHWTKDLTISPDGKYLYAGVGSNSNIVENGIEAEKGRAAIWQIDRQSGAARVYASGLRNPNGLTFEPDTGTLYAVINERDELGPNLVPDYMTSVKDGAFYGWPWSYYGDHVDPRVHPQRPDMVAKAIAPDYALSSHVAPLGMIFSKGSAMPQKFANGAFIGEHGSWNRTFFNGYKVVYVPFENGKPTGKAEDVVTGFLDGDKTHGRPVGVAIDGTGALLVADDAGNTVWRVAASDGSTTSPQSAANASASGQAAAVAPANPSAAPSSAEPAGTASSDTTAPDSQSSDQASTPAATLDGQQPAENAGSAPVPSQTQIAPATLPAGTVQQGKNASSQ